MGMDPAAVRQRRVALGVSQRELARRAQITRACLGRCERGQTRPNRVTLEAIALALRHLEDERDDAREVRR